MFTQNAFCAAPVQLAKMHLSEARPRWLVINTGNATACDIESLITLGQKSVKQRFGIDLVPEVRIVGRADVTKPAKEEGADV